jgi:hypothetical protein
LALKSRLLVNGIQKDDIDAGLASFMGFSLFFTDRKNLYQLAKS